MSAIIKWFMRSRWLLLHVKTIVGVASIVALSSSLKDQYQGTYDKTTTNLLEQTCILNNIKLLCHHYHLPLLDIGFCQASSWETQLPIRTKELVSSIILFQGVKSLFVTSTQELA